MSDIPAELSLDVSSALAAVASVEAALVAAGDAFQASVQGAVGSLDVATIPIEVDASSVSSDIDAAVAASDSTVAVDADVTADTSAAQASIDELEGQTVEVGVEADTSGAQAALDDLGTSGHNAEAGLGAAENATKGLEVGASALEGSLLGSSKALSAVGPAGAAAAATIGVLVSAAHTLVEEGIKAESSIQRFNLVLGQSATRVRQIDVGGLNEDLKTLANRLGADDENLQDATSRFFAFGLANGTARSQVEQTTKEIDALAAHAVALNPALGEVGDTVNRLTQALATGRNTADFGVSLQRSAVVAEALRENIGKTTETLTRYDLAAAGAKLATDQLGDSLATGVNAGAQNVAIQFRSVQQEFKNTLEEAGVPILGPTLDLLRALEPAIQPVAAGFAAILQTVIPLATALAGTLVPALQVVTPALETLAKVEAFLQSGGGQSVEQHGGFLDGLKQVVGEMSILPFAARVAKAAFGDTAEAASEAGAEIVNAFQGISGAVASGVGLTTNVLGGFLTNLTATNQARDALASKFQGGLPQIGDAFAVEAGRVAASAKSIDKSSNDLIAAATKLEDKFSAGLPSISDAFKQGISPEDLAKAKDTLEAFIQGVEGVSKSAADSAQAVIDKAQAQGGTGLAGFLQQLREQTAQIAAFQGTIATLKNRGALDLAAAFADRGVESAAVAAEAAGLSDADLSAAEQTVEKAKAVKQDAVASLGLFADQLVTTFGPKGAEAGATFGEGLVANLASPDIIAKAKAEAAKLAEAAATPSGGGAAAPQAQSLAGFLAALKSQSGDIKAFQADLDKIASEGGTVLADTLREQGISAARAADQAAGLAPAQVLVAEQAVRDAQGVLASAEEDNKAAADRMTAFMAATAARASAGFTDNFVVNIGPELGAIGGQIQAASPPIVLASSTLGAQAGVAFGTGLKEGVNEALQGGALAGLFLGGSAVTLPPITLAAPVGAAAAQFGQAAPAVAQSSQPTVNVENINVTPPRDASADEQADAIATALAYRVQGAR